MPKMLEWGVTGNKFFETGCEKGVLYPVADDGTYPKGVVWNGLKSVNENPSGAEETALWADDTKYGSLYSAEEYGCSIEAYMYPDEFAECDGSSEIVEGAYVGQQDRKGFGLSYVTKVGNDVKKLNYGYKLHIVWGCMASPSQKNYTTVNDNPDAGSFSWDVKSTPVPVKGFKPTSSIVLDSVKVGDEKMAAIEKILYGSDDADAMLPTPDKIVEILKGVQAAG